MTLVKIGKTTINFDLVTCIRELAPAGASTGILRVEFGPSYHIDLADGFAQAKNWLDSHSTTPPLTMP